MGGQRIEMNDEESAPSVDVDLSTESNEEIRPPPTVALKRCKVCTEDLSLTSYNKDAAKCKSCQAKYSRQHYLSTGKAQKKAKYDADPRAKIEYQTRYYKANKPKVKTRQKAHYQKNRVRLIAEQRARDAKRDPVKVATYNREWRLRNKHKTKIYSRRKLRRIDYRLRLSVSNGVYQGLRFGGGEKRGISCFVKLGYRPSKLKAHLESLFEPWMSWDNWGGFSPKTWDDADESTWKWNIDHIIPQFELPFSSMDDENFHRCWALANLRPLSAKQNCYEGAYRLTATDRKKKEDNGNR